MARKIDELENEIKQLSPEQLQEFREWYEKFDSDEWDKKIEADAKNGKLDILASGAISESKAGKRPIRIDIDNLRGQK